MKLTDTQTAALTAAAARPNGAILPLPAPIRGGAVGKVCDALVAKSLAVYVGLPGEQTLVIGDEGRRALGLEVKRTASAVNRPSILTPDRRRTLTPFLLPARVLQ